ncbi:glycosyltransferase family 2 protein [candidate division KSB1 bacterium]
MVELSVIIITWNKEKLLHRCLDSIHKNNKGADFEVIVVDNASKDKTLNMLKNFQKTRIIRNRKNKGVAPARNQGIKIAKGKYIMMLDNDTEVKSGCFKNIIKFMDNNKEVWCAGTKTFRPDGKLEYSARTFYNLPTMIFRRTPLGKMFPNNKYVKKHLMTKWDHKSSREVDWVVGASLITRKEAIAKMGYFDERYPLCFDDVDWCYRVKLKGKKVSYIHDAEIIHYIQGLSRNMFSKNALLHFISMLRFYWKFRNVKIPKTKT